VQTAETRLSVKKKLKKSAIGKREQAGQNKEQRTISITKIPLMMI
jgi:hypothetical protein